MNLPTTHQFAVAGTHAVALGAGAVSALAFAGFLSSGGAADATADINRIAADLKDLYGAVAGLVGIGAGVYATIKSSPFASLFRASADIAADPVKMNQLKDTPLAQQAPLVAVTDRLPDVAGVGTTRTDAGLALAQAVPSTTVQTVQKSA